MMPRGMLELGIDHNKNEDVRWRQPSHAAMARQFNPLSLIPLHPMLLGHPKNPAVTLQPAGISMLQKIRSGSMAGRRRAAYTQPRCQLWSDRPCRISMWKEDAASWRKPQNRPFLFFSSTWRHLGFACMPHNEVVSCGWFSIV